MSANIHFGTDGWRAIIGEDFTDENLARAVDAAARAFRASDAWSEERNTVYVGHDTRLDGARYSVLAATVLASHGLDVKLTDRFCPTPTLCWTVGRDEAAVGGVMLTSSHNPAEYLGIKLRMSDGGASPKSFTDDVEAIMTDEPPACFAQAVALADARKAGELGPDTAGLPFAFADLMTPYLDDLRSLVDVEAIRAAGLRVVVDPMYGAGKGYLAGLLRDMGVEVTEVDNADDPTFAGLHPEPILPWIADGVEAVKAGSYDGGLLLDGDADRTGGIDENGNFVSPHRVLALMVGHLAEDKGVRGRVVRTLSGSVLLERQCARFGLPLTTTPVGFKWIYEEMCKGDVMIGGEESGGIGVPTHVMERDGLLSGLTLVEMMAQKKRTLGQLVSDMFDQIGGAEYARRDLRLTQEQKDAFLARVAAFGSRDEAAECAEAFGSAGLPVAGASKMDGLKITFEDGSWLLLRPSGTEPLVRVYAESATMEQVERILDAGCAFAQG